MADKRMDTAVWQFSKWAAVPGNASRISAAVKTGPAALQLLWHSVTASEQANKLMPNASIGDKTKHQMRTHFKAWCDLPGNRERLTFAVRNMGRDPETFNQVNAESLGVFPD
jgi:hypothetical protein